MVLKISNWSKKFQILAIAILLLAGLPLAVGQTVNAAVNPDLIVTVSEDYLNRVIKADLEEKSPQGVKDVSVVLTENEPIEVNAVLRIGGDILGVDQKVSVEANVSIENDTLKIDPNILKVGFLTLPEETWVGPIKSAMEEVESSANEAYQDALTRGYRVTDVATGNNTLTLWVMAPDQPFQDE
jgi:hypothetical protein